MRYCAFFVYSYNLHQYKVFDYRRSERESVWCIERSNFMVDNKDGCSGQPGSGEGSFRRAGVLSLFCVGSELAVGIVFCVFVSWWIGSFFHLSNFCKIMIGFTLGMSQNFFVLYRIAKRK
ncbi:hypothetical protein [Candidatus Hydrogenosomobacter endosymbioticus]|uniref:hypothetical protein n=1 Tax=Candidatus Hydrogenosomobacter endosymbioticus TaxID=2558174 RepID=UPI001F22E1B2|nr:hypothetical protein [Candidatus Hydrogenosomobacter endosymbioticus]